MVEYYIIGAGGQSRQVLSMVRKVWPNSTVLGFIGLEEEKDRVINGVKVLVESELEAAKKNEVFLLNGLGRPNRSSVIEKLLNLGFSFHTIIHSSANIGEAVSIGNGTIIQSGVGVMTNVEIGKFVLVDMNSTIGHDVSIGDYSTISTGVNIAGGVSIGNGCWIGSGTTIIEGVSIGDNVLIGAGSVVTRDVKNNRLSYGVPAKTIREIMDVSLELMRNTKKL